MVLAQTGHISYVDHIHFISECIDPYQTEDAYADLGLCWMHMS